LRGFPATITDWAVLDVCLEIIDTTRGPDIEATSGPAHIVLTDPDGNTIMVDPAPLKRPPLSRVRSALTACGWLVRRLVDYGHWWRAVTG
jgi:hypothetical protein